MSANSPSSEPTEIISMLGAYQTQLRFTSGSVLPGSQSNKRSLATRLAFDDTLDESVLTSDRKVARVGVDPFSSHLGMKRFPSENTGTISSLQSENQDLKLKLKEIESVVAGSKAHATAMDTKVAKMELELEREKTERHHEKDKFERERRVDVEKIENLQLKLKQMKQRENDKLEEFSRNRRSSIDRSGELESKLRTIREDKLKLEEELSKLKLLLSNRPDIDKLSYKKEIHDFEMKISSFEQNEEILKCKAVRAEEKIKENEMLLKDLVAVKGELKMEKLRGDMLQGELDANKEAVLQRKVMRDKLEGYNALERENISLRSRNSLLVDTAENSALLKEQIRQRERDIERMSSKMEESDKIRAQLDVAQKELKEWDDMVNDWMTAEDRNVLAHMDIGIVKAKEVVRSWQKREVSYVEEITKLKCNGNTYEMKFNQELEAKEKLEEQVEKIKEEKIVQAKLVQKLQRKLILVTKERDSYKGILDSYEKEITMTGGQLDQERIAALEKNIEEYRAVVEMLEEENGKPAVTMGHTSPNEKDEKLKHLKERNERLEMELERRALKGDFDPTVAKVLHFTTNPTAQAIQKRESQVSELLNENTTLKARIQLLEQGQTTDLTMMVGAKVEEGEGEKVHKLKEQLNKAEVMKERLMEAFKKTSHDFREVVYHLTGYRIDVLQDNKYRLLPLYAESQEDSLLFQKSQAGDIQMLESEFSLELGELMEEHLERNNSIPMLLAGLTMQLFYKQNGADEETEDGRCAMVPEESSNSDDIIEIDDD